ncbi:AsmA family protein [Cronobacter dublinensis]|uniref:AsmA family protein n=1 Tax=Cronobacter dublinensis TaxID=413497 RepID=UPI001DC2608C|nr:AsmA family protein [Cronobacter dublinensis subsp. dublinensis]EGT5668993.1 AsmA family protein [Cronobacter dublinensis subsp. dublinensis]EGT5671444.1 AsmA family protein [Cronobacter dublinensis subsp. dublinensis]EGT5675721.1 AsmA family protein [Cronobacter dublinensis subsp. dublinensis]EGT5684447.1 AsmA family protein [Cronobacter dublinensis subsp. dublinensis]
MKFLGKLIIALLVAVLLILLALYALLQTRWGAGWLTGWVNQHSGYHITFDEMDHRFSAPSHLVLKNVTFGRRGQPATLVAQKVDIGLSSRQITEPMHVDTILLYKGTINLSPSTAPLPFRADRLQLSDMAFNSPQTGWDLSAQRVNGGISPWLPEAGKILGSKADIALSAGSLTLNGMPASNVLVQGEINNNEVTITNLGADIARGALTGNARRLANGGWVVDTLRLSEIRLQTDKTVSDFLKPLTTLPSLALGRIDVTDARLEGPGWAATDLDISLRNLTLANGSWQSDDGRVSMNASEVVYGSLHFLDPIVNADLSAQGVALRQFSSRWEGGMVRTSGSWQREGNALTLDELALAGLEYTLPADWKKHWQETLPAWLQSVTVKKLSASRNLIIDIDPQWPFQLTALDAWGNNLQLARSGEWGIWGGNATLNAAAATFNRVDVRRPSLTLNANPSTIAISELSAFAGQGMLQATATISQLPQRMTTLSLNGRAVPVNVLHQWGWPQVPLEGDGNIQLTASGSLAADAPLRPSVNGQLQATGTNGQQVQQAMQNGVVPGA